MELDSFFATESQCVQEHTNKLLRKKRRPQWLLPSLFGFSKVSKGLFSFIYRKRALKIPVFHAERIYVFLAVYLSHQRTVL